MKNVTIRTNNDESTEQLTTLLKSLDLVESVEVYDDSDDLTPEELSIVEESMAEYRKDPLKAQSWEEVYNEISAKYGI